MQRRAVADVRDAKLAGEFEIFLPAPIVAGAAHLMPPPAPTLGRRIAALEPGREDEAAGRSNFLGRAFARSRCSRRLHLRLRRRIAYRMGVERADGEAEQRMPEYQAGECRRGEGEQEERPAES